jgi:hypothetical protein
VVVMGRLGRGRDLTARLAVVEGNAFPAVAVERFCQEHPEIHPEDAALVETAARQWFRLLVPEPKAALALPSRAVSDFWRALLHAEDAYRQFCQDAFGDFVPHRPPPSGPGEEVADAPGLLRTLRLADRDEPEAPHGLPWLFRVDHAVKVLNARRYVRNCGGGPECYPVPGTVCLRHLEGPGKSLRRTYDPRRDKPAARPDQGSG